MKNKESEGNYPDAQREGWQVEELSEEASLAETDEITRQMLRGDETKGNADDRDIVGSIDSNETPHGRRESKHKTGVDRND